MTGPNHDALCIALARRDSRLCATVARDERTTCRAILARDPAKCVGAPRCVRLVQRWKSMMPEESSHPELGTRVRAELVRSEEGGIGRHDIDLSDAAGAATLSKTPLGSRILLGDPGSAPWPPAALATEPRISLVLLATPANIKQGSHPIDNEGLAFELLLPKIGKISSSDERTPATITVDLLGTEISSPVRFKLEVDLGPEHLHEHLQLTVNTFVRDVVATGPRALKKP
jgi:hypothetical protein